MERAVDAESIRQILANLEPINARVDKLVEIFSLKDKLSGMPDPVYIVLTDEATGGEMRIYDLAEIQRLKRDDPQGEVEIVQIRIRFDKADELAAVEGVLKAARGEHRNYRVFVRPQVIH